MRDAPLMFIPDLQIPFHHEKSLEFAHYIKRHYSVPDENCYCTGDEIDALFGGMWKKDPNGRHSAITELEATIDELKRWYSVFPRMKLAISNHGSRWIRKATEAEIPSVMMKQYEAVLQAPDGWKWKKHWRIDTKFPIILEHGDDWGGQTPHKSAALHNGVSTIIGHFHSIAGIERIKTNGFDVFGMCAGSLIDFDAYAFNYARNAKFKPQLGIGLVFNNGRTPTWIPLD
jgi:hypothetical protein